MTHRTIADCLNQAMTGQITVGMIDEDEAERLDYYRRKYEGKYKIGRVTSMIGIVIICSPWGTDNADLTSRLYAFMVEYRLLHGMNTSVNQDRNEV
jgi:hypothetical protein